MITLTSIYKISTGEIVSSGGVMFDPDQKQNQIACALAPWGSETHALVESGSDAATQYVQVLAGVPTVVDKTPIQVALDKTTIMADGADIATLSGLPDPCSILIDDTDPLTETTTVNVTGGGFTFSTEDPGTYTFEVRGRFPFLPLKVEITAT